MSLSQSPRGATVAVIGGGATGLSAGWWLAREGVDVVVLDRGIIGWGASGRNGGGCSHHFSPLFVEEQRLWPHRDAQGQLGCRTLVPGRFQQNAFDAAPIGRPRLNPRRPIRSPNGRMAERQASA